jgi:hypothetical protein
LPSPENLPHISEDAILELIEIIGQLPVTLDGLVSVENVAFQLENGPLLPHEDDGSTFEESDFLMARRFLILLWQTYQTAHYIHVNGYGGYYRSHLFLLHLLASMTLCDNASDKHCFHHQAR